MLWAIAIVLGVLWVLGVASTSTFGGYVHLLIVVALLLAAFRLVQIIARRREKRTL
jgi:hypothetical protein